MLEAVDLREQIYKEYKHKINGYIRSKVSNQYDAEDLTSYIFLKIYQKLDSFDSTKASMSTWVYTITRNTLTDYFRTRKVECEYSDEVLCDIEAEDMCFDDNELDDLASALDMLDERARDLIILRYYNGYTLLKISDMMKMSYANTKIVHNKALVALRKHMTVIL